MNSTISSAINSIGSSEVDVMMYPHIISSMSLQNDPFGVQPISEKKSKADMTAPISVFDIIIANGILSSHISIKTYSVGILSVPFYSLYAYSINLFLSSCSIGVSQFFDIVFLENRILFIFQRKDKQKFLSLQINKISIYI